MTPSKSQLSESSHKPLVTVVIPTKNSEQTIEVCLKSIKEQTYPNIEIVVVDNYSTDATTKIAQKYAKVFLKGLERSTQRNFGAMKANGEYLLFVDSDMELTQGVIKECVETALKEEAHAVIIPEVSVGKGFWGKCRELEKECYIGDETIEAARFFLRETFWICGGYNEKMAGGGEDWDLHLRIKKACYKIARVSNVIKHHEEHLGLANSLRKKYRYAKTIAEYVGNHPDYAIRQLTPFRMAFIRNKRKIAAKPTYALGLLVMKTLELLFGAFGMLDKNNTYKILSKIAGVILSFKRTQPRLKSSGRTRDFIKRWFMAQAEERHTWVAQFKRSKSPEKERWKHYFLSSKNLIPRLEDGDLVLDLGCGPDGLIFHFPAKVTKVGIDPLVDSYVSLGYDIKNKANLIKAVAEYLPIKSETAGFIFIINTLDHVISPKQVLVEVQRVLRPNAFILLDVNTEPLLDKILMRIGYRPPLDRAHLHKLDAREVLRTLEELGYQTLACRLNPPINHLRAFLTIMSTFTERLQTRNTDQPKAWEIPFYLQFLYGFIRTVDLFLYYVEKLWFAGNIQILVCLVATQKRESTLASTRSS